MKSQRVSSRSEAAFALRTLFLMTRPLVVEIKGRGLVIISGCAHSGIINTIKHAQKITGVQEVYAVIGSFHLAGADEERMALTTEELRKLEPRIVRPVHCTSFEALCLLREPLGSQCRPLTSGDLIEF